MDRTIFTILVMAAACATTRDTVRTDRVSATSAAVCTTCGWRWGVTVDDITHVDDVVDALAALPARPMTRIVFDERQPAAYYAAAATSIHRVSDVMGELVDSQFVDRFSVEAYRRRAREYLAALGPHVDWWEVGNEVNGEWLGASSDVVAKVAGAYDEVKSSGRPAVLTLYYNEGCSPDDEHEMFRWVRANLPRSLRAGFDVVLVSYYEDDCAGARPDWPMVFAQLGTLFPRASLGFGECGTAHPSKKEEFLRRYYSIRLAEPRFVGGFFWWYFTEDMVPRSRPLWRVLAEVMTPP